MQTVAGPQRSGGNAEMHRQKFSSVLSPVRISRSLSFFLYSELNVAAENPESRIQLPVVLGSLFPLSSPHFLTGAFMYMAMGFIETFMSK